MFNIVKKSINWAGKELSIETGKIARQADGAVVIKYGDTSLLCTTVFNKKATEGVDFFPMTVNYIEKSCAAGKIPGGFFKREGKQSEKEVLLSRLIDRPIRPLFPEGFHNETQVTATLLSYEKDSDIDVSAMIGSVASVAISGLPISSLVVGVRIGFVNNEFIVNPKLEQLQNSKLDLFVAATKNGIMMVESEVHEFSEEKMLEALELAHKECVKIVDFVESFVKAVGKEQIQFTSRDDSKILDEMSSKYSSKIKEAYKLINKSDRCKALDLIKDDIKSSMINEEVDELRLFSVFHNLQAKIVREDILSNHHRIDGRNLDQIRQIEIELNPLPTNCVHGSALFTRGETQSLNTLTLGVTQDEQILDGVEQSSKRDAFMLHYNFPPYSVGEVGRFSGPGRREIGHGNLAKKAIRPLLPSKDEFPYTVRIVSDITESNGSSSMATVCSSSLALMSGGVPLKKHISGIAMGLIKDGDKYAILTDIMGDEDHLGDMDFKVAGTYEGITALQMDLKIDSVNMSIMREALTKAKIARVSILDKMYDKIKQSSELSNSAMKIRELKIPIDKIAEVIGKGGANIKSIIEKSGCKIEINDSGKVLVYGSEEQGLDLAQKLIEGIAIDLSFGEIHIGKVDKILDFGAVVILNNGKSGLIHISEIANERIEKVEDKLSLGQEISVKFIGLDEKRRLKFSLRVNEEHSDRSQSRGNRPPRRFDNDRGGDRGNDRRPRDNDRSKGDEEHQERRGNYQKEEQSSSDLDDSFASFAENLNLKK